MQSPFNTDVLNFPKCSGCHINNNSTQLKQAMYWILGKHIHFKELLLLLLSRFSHVRLCVTPQMAAHQAPPSLGFSRQEHWSGLPLPSPMHESEKWKWSRSVVSDSSRPHGLQPTRLLHPWNFPGKSTGVGRHCLLLQRAMIPQKGIFKYPTQEAKTNYPFHDNPSSSFSPTGIKNYWFKLSPLLTP